MGFIDIVVSRLRMTPASTRPFIEDPMTLSCLLPTVAGPYIYFTVAPSVIGIDVRLLCSGGRMGFDLMQLL